MTPWKPAFWFAVAAVTFLSALLQLVQGTGKGPVGIYAIDERYVMIAECAVDAILILDTQKGGAIVGQYILHDESLAPPATCFGQHTCHLQHASSAHLQHWARPTGVGSCGSCKYVYVSAGMDPYFYRIRLQRSLADMARDHDFSTFAQGTLSPTTWKDKQGGQRPLDHSLRMIAIQRDGSVGYIVHNTKGLYQFDPQEDTTSQKHASITTEQVIPISQLGFDISGCSLAPSGKSLLITSETKLFIIDVSSISKQPKVSAIYDLEKVCGGGAHMHFRDAALVSKSTIFVVGHLFAGGSQNEGMSLFKLTVDNDGQMSCHASTGGKGKPAGWTDGHPNDVIFTRPHAMTLMPGIGAISVTDIDNRAVRYVELVHKNEAYKLGRVSTLSYDEHLWLKMYGHHHNETSSWATTLQQGEGAMLVFGNNGTILNQPESLEELFGKQDELVKKMGWVKATEFCASKNAQLCSPERIRKASSFEALPDEASPPQQQEEEIWIWTARSCHSCWLHYQGRCPAPPPGGRHGGGGGESARQRTSAAWGADHRMAARARRSDGRVRLECAPRAAAVPALPVCCAARGRP